MIILACHEYSTLQRRHLMFANVFISWCKSQENKLLFQHGNVYWENSVIIYFLAKRLLFSWTTPSCNSENGDWAARNLLAWVSWNVKDFKCYPRKLLYRSFFFSCLFPLPHLLNVYQWSERNECLNVKSVHVYRGIYVYK